tara:strand:+ start:142 stop:255 length:114 start_codon:yes stop_codon:yes gene_type:complete
MKERMKKWIDKFHVWHLYYRREIVFFIAGFLIGAIFI